MRDDTSGSSPKWGRPIRREASDCPSKSAFIDQVLARRRGERLLEKSVPEGTGKAGIHAGNGISRNGNATGWPKGEAQLPSMEIAPEGPKP